VTRRRSRVPAFVGLDALEATPDSVDREQGLDDQRALEKMMALIHALEPLDRQIILLYLEEFDAAAIAEITGCSAGNVATKVHRLKKLLARRFQKVTP
jgi:RNA polymerase sigma-70 factor (ECF subfamily)